MMRFAVPGWVLLAAATLLACGDGGQTLGTGTSSGSGGQSSGAGGATGEPLPCELAGLLDDRCLQCHDEPTQFGATRSFLSREDLVAGPADGEATVAEACIARMMLPASDDKRMPLMPQPAASQAEIAVFQEWVSAGFPARDASEVCE